MTPREFNHAILQAIFPPARLSTLGFVAKIDQGESGPDNSLATPFRLPSVIYVEIWTCGLRVLLSTQPRPWGSLMKLMRGA